MTHDDETDDHSPDLSFDGAEDMLRAWSRGIRPDLNLMMSEWADRHRWPSSRAAAEPGCYRTARTPYLREIMDALSPGLLAQRIVFMEATQVGATEAGNSWIGFRASRAHVNTLIAAFVVAMAAPNLTYLIGSALSVDGGTRTPADDWLDTVANGSDSFIAAAPAAASHRIASTNHRLSAGL